MHILNNKCIHVHTVPALKNTVWEETFEGVNLEVLWIFMNVFSTKSGGVVTFCGTSEKSVIVFFVKILFSTSSWKFIPAKGSCCTVCSLSIYYNVPLFGLIWDVWLCVELAVLGLLAFGVCKGASWKAVSDTTIGYENASVCMLSRKCTKILFKNQRE